MAYFRRKFGRRSGVSRSNKNYSYKVVYKRGIRQARNKMGSYGQPITKSGVISLINNKIRYINQEELKTSPETIFTQPVMDWPSDASGGPTFYFKSLNSLFDLGEGTSVATRIGNKVTLKKATIKFCITPDFNAFRLFAGTPADPTYDDSPQFLPNTYQGYLIMFLGKRVNGESMDNTLDKLLQNGSTTITPAGKQYDKLYRINKDMYKIYWAKRFKCGMAQAPLVSQASVLKQYDATVDNLGNTVHYPKQGPNPNYQNIMTLPNNDFKMTHMGQIEITNYIGKNATIRYNDSDTKAYLPSSLANLSLFAIWSPVGGEVAKQPTGPPPGLHRTSFYKIFTSFHHSYKDS